MGDAEVLALFLGGKVDTVTMREGFEQLFGLSDGAGLSAEEEYRVRHPDYVMEMPQTNERIRGRDAMRSMQEAFPNPPKITLRRVVGCGHGGRSKSDGYVRLVRHGAGWSGAPRIGWKADGDVPAGSFRPARSAASRKGIS